jgi:hypothetical protein
MATVSVASDAMMNGNGVRRDTWGEGSSMVADQNGQLMRTTPQGHAYGWILDLSDLTATDWRVEDSTSSHLQTPL